MDAAHESVELIAAYRAADYFVRLPAGRRAALRVGAGCPRPLAALLERCDVRVGGFITAWNPRSRPAPREDNRRRQRELLAGLRDAHVQVLLAAAGVGAGWREPSLAALGAPLAALDTLARRFGQNAILTFGVEGRVRLRLYRDGWRGIVSGDDVDFAPAIAQ